MLEELQNFIADNDLIHEGDKILLAVSGGIDSMVMANIFLQLPYKIGIAHCNFKLRGEDSEQDKELVRNFCESKNIPFHWVNFETLKYAEENGISIQMAARDLRYAWFEKIRKKENYSKIATAHNLNDHIETVLINLIRGSGLTGLSGIRPSTGFIIRPLLFATREIITDFCKWNNISYREDKSNSEIKYIRNKLRHLVIPVLKEINPSVEYTLMETAGRFRDINSLLDDFINLLHANNSYHSGDLVIFNLNGLKNYLHNRTLLYEMFKIYGLKGTGINDLISIIEGKTGGYLITQSHRIYKNRNELIVSPLQVDIDAEIIFRDFDELQRYHGFAADIVTVDRNFEIPRDSCYACVDIDMVEFPLILRKWNPGDKYFPLGMNNAKKLSDYFIDRKYPIPVKERKKVLVSAGNIIWILGDLIDNRYRITERTTRALILKLL